MMTRSVKDITLTIYVRYYREVSVVMCFVSQVMKNFSLDNGKGEISIPQSFSKKQILFTRHTNPS